jgi:hypothetical protein
MAAKRHGVRQAAAMEPVDSYGISQLPRLLRPALEFHSHGGRTQLFECTIIRNDRAAWNSTAMVGVHSYGIPEQVQTDSGVECTHRFPAARLTQSGPGTCALFAQILYDRSFPSPALAWAWQSFSARLTIFSLGTKTAVRTNRRKSWRRIKNSTCSKLAKFT